MILALALTLSLGAWAQTHQRYSGQVEISALQQGDTLVQGADLYGNESHMEEVFLSANRANGNGTLVTEDLSLGRFVLVGANGAISANDVYTPVTADGQDGDAWVVTAKADNGFGGYNVTIGGITIAVAPEVQRTAQGNWLFAMPAGQRALQITYKDYPQLAWTLGGSAMPNDTSINLYRGFDADFFASLGLTTSQAFAQSHSSSGLTEITTPDPSWQNNYSDPVSASALPGFQPMTLEEAQALDAPTTSGEARVIYAIENNTFSSLYYFNGEFIASEIDARYGMIYDFVGPQSKIYYTTAASSPLRYGSTAPSVVTIDAEGHAQAVGTGEAKLYAVFDGDDDYRADSVWFTLNLHSPDTLTLAANGNGTVEALVGSGSTTWNNETWANTVTDQNLSPLTFGDITISTTGSMKRFSSYNPDKLSFFVSKFDDAQTLTFSSDGGNFSRIEMTMSSEYSQYNPDIIPADGWTFDGYTAVWEGDAPSVTVTSCSTYVSQITFTRGAGSNGIVALNEAKDTLIALPGAQVQVVATAVDGNYLSAWSPINRAPAHLLSDTATITMPAPSGNLNLTATFTQNPLLTLAANDGGSVTLDGVSVDTFYTITFDHVSSPEGSRNFTIPASRLPYDTTFNYGSDYVQNASAEETSGKLSVDPDNHAVTVRISGAFEGGYYHCILFHAGTNITDDWFITCEAGTQAKTPYGISKTGDNTYRVLPGTQLSVTATPDSAHYLAHIGSTDTVSNHACSYSFVMPDEDTELEANFALKPTLTLTQTDGGTLEAIVPQGAGEETLLTTIMSNANTNFKSGSQTFDDIATVTFGYGVSNDGDELGWYSLFGVTLTVTPVEGITITRVKFTCDMGSAFDETAPFEAVLGEGDPWFNAFMFVNGNNYGEYGVTKIEVYGYQNVTPNVIASSTPNTYIIDYGTPVTVKATPDAQHYLVRFSDDDNDTNSNIAVEKTYDSVIADIPLQATFQAKPVLTLAANDGGSLTLEGLGGTTLTLISYSNIDLPDYQTVSREEARALCGTDITSGTAYVFYRNSGTNYFGIKFQNGVEQENDIAVSNISYFVPDPYDEGLKLYYTTGHSLDGVTATETENQYRVDYGTEVTVKATPDSIHYLATLGGVTMGSNTAKDTTFAVTATTNLEANFTLKPTLTLAHNEGGTLEAIIPSGAPTTAQLNVPSEWMSDNTPVTASDMEGFVALTDDEAQAIACPNAEGHVYVIHNFVGEGYIKIIAFTNGVKQAQQSFTLSGTHNDIHDNFWGQEEIKYYFTTGATAANVIASTTEPNTYYIDYGTSVTVKATPSDTAYLVRFVGDDDTNSNTAVEKTYGPLTAALTTAEATFNAKPVLTLAQNESWGKVTLAGMNDAPATPSENPVETTVNFSPSEFEDVTSGPYQLTKGDITVSVSNGACSTAYDHIRVYKNAIFTVSSSNGNIKSVQINCKNSYGPAGFDNANYYDSDVEGGWTVNNASLMLGAENKQVRITGITVTYDSLPKAASTLPAGVAKLTDTTYRVDYGTTLTVQADATELHHVQAWLDQNADTLQTATYSNYFVTTPENLFPKNSTLTFTMTQDTVATAMFGINSYDVTAMMAAGQDERGTVKALYTDILGEAQSAINDTVEITAQGGSTTTLVAIPANTCFDFAYWQVGDEQIEKDTLTVTAATQAVAYFVYHEYTGDTTVDVCDQFTWHGLIYSTVPEVAPTYIYKTAQDECDSTVTLHLTLRYATTGDTVASECDQFSWFEHTGLTASTEELQHVFVNAVGCDSTVTLHLTIRYSNTGVETATACDQYEWQGTVYTESNTTDQRVLTNAANCDSTVTLNLTVNYHHDTTVYWQTSGDFVWGRGTTYQETFTENGTYNRTIDTKQGCDSNVTIVLAYLPHTTPLPTIYNIMGVSLFINHFPEGTDKIDYIYYRWYKNGEVVSEGEGVDSYSEDGDMLNGCFYLEISTEPTLTYWAQSNEVCLGNVGIDDVKDITMTLAPNPVVRGQQVNVTVSESNLQGAVATVYDAQGRQVMNFELRNSKFEIQTSELSTGIYTVRIVMADGRMATKKIVVK